MMMARNALFLLAALLLAACGGLRGNTVDDYNRPEREQLMDRQGGLFGDEGLVLFGNQRSGNRTNEQGGALGVNAYLWRGALDTLSFMPLVSADPFGGVIITDWYTPSETPNERMKVQVTILDRDLRADGVRVSVFKQQTSPKGGNWVDAQVDPRTNIDIENAILTRARQLRIAGGS